MGFILAPSAQAAAASGDVKIGNGAVVLGDSISIVPGNSNQALNSTVGTYLAGGWFHEFCARSGQAARFVRNSGVSGENTTQMLARLQSTVLAYSPDLVLLLAGNNDPVTSVSEATSRANFRALVDGILAAGAIPVIGTITPRTVSTYRAAHLRLNEFLRGLAVEYGVPLVDFYKAMVDPATGGPATGLTYDGVHPTDGAGGVSGAAVAGATPTNNGVKMLVDRALADLAGQPWFVPGRVPLVSTQETTSPGSPPNLVTNALFLTDTNADGLADSWTKSGPGVASLVTVPGVVGQMQQLAITGDVAAVDSSLSRVITFAGVAGHKYAFSCVIDSTVGTSGIGYGMQCKITTSVGSFDMSPAVGWHNETSKAILYMEYTPANAPTQMTLTLSAHTNAGMSGTGQVRMGQVGVFDLTDLRT